MKDNVLVAIVVVIAVIFGGTSLLFGIGNNVSVALGPLTAKVGELTAVQKEIQGKLNGREDQNIAVQLALINQRLSILDARLSNPSAFGPRAPQNAPQNFHPVDLNKIYTIDEGSSAVLGPKNAPVTIVEFSDFQCPFCARFHPVVKEVLKAYPNQVRLIIKNFPLPFHPNALPAAKLALAAREQGKYFEMVDLLMQNGGAATDDKIKDYAKELNINYKKLTSDLKNKDAQWQKVIDDDKALAQQVNVRGTPTYFINGRMTQARDLNGYKSEIDKILSQKKT